MACRPREFSARVLLALGDADDVVVASAVSLGRLHRVVHRQGLSWWLERQAQNESKPPAAPSIAGVHRMHEIVRQAEQYLALVINEDNAHYEMGSS
jgi:hypothetical protein